MYKHGFPRDWSTLKKLIWLQGSPAMGENLPWSEFTGNPLSVFVPKIHDLREATVEFEPQQDLHGYANPWPAGGGVNKMPPPSSISAPTGITAVNKDGIITLNGTISDSTITVAVDVPTVTFASAGQKLCLTNTLTNATIRFYYQGSQIDYFSLTTQNRVISESQLTALQGKTIDQYRFQINPQTLTNATIGLMLMDSSVADTSFAPYSNICPISGYTGLDLVKTGENLIPSNDASGRTYADITYAVNSDGSITVTGTATASSWWKGATSISDWHFIKAGTYKMKGGISNNKILYIIGKFVDGTGVNNATVTGGVYDRGNGLTFTLPQDAYITYQIQIVNGTECDDTFYPIISVDDAEWEPYTGETYSVTWQDEAGTVYGGTYNFVTGVLTGTYGIVDLGTIDWYYEPNYNRHYFSCSKLPLEMEIPAASVAADAFCTIFPIVSSTYGWNNRNSKTSLAVDESKIVRVYNAGTAAGNDFKVEMSGVMFCYKLATPLTFQLDPQTITALKGINVFFSNGKVITILAKAKATA